MIFGIKPTRKKSGKQFYSFLGKSIHISKDRKFIINSNTSQKNFVPRERLWEIIVLNPPTFLPTIKELEEYGEILLFNDYENWAELQKTKAFSHAKLSNKYTNIIAPAIDAAQNKIGKGINLKKIPPNISYYTYRSPPFKRKNKKKIITGKGISKKHRRKNIIEFFPANKSVLLKKLIYLLGEYHCGNTKILRDEIVPIINYLKSQNALPQKFDSKYMNWIYD